MGEVERMPIDDGAPPEPAYFHVWKPGVQQPYTVSRDFFISQRSPASPDPWGLKACTHWSHRCSGAAND